MFCSYARCAVHPDYRTRHVEYLPLHEGPARITKQLMQIGMALALVQGKTSMDLEVYEILKKIGRDLISGQRLRIIEHLWEEAATEGFRTWQKTKDIADAVSLPTNTTILLLEDLMIVGVLNRNRDDEKGEKAPYQWQLTDNAEKMISAAQVFDEYQGINDIPF